MGKTSPPDSREHALMPVVHFVTKDELGIAEIEPLSTGITILHIKSSLTRCAYALKSRIESSAYIH